ncbi:hypothetical protein CBOM_07690 [Ceraceosorus bombacis]|uniref:Uncharacterized protein n=1 Tax=Ceraceosorus bombacis TaxID=401625 RepID=A0A0N7LAS5_9BASI|nr:hypothetical protein CBOM_07690 [Ceraceosorus bombacis]
MWCKVEGNRRQQDPKGARRGHHLSRSSLSGTFTPFVLVSALGEEWDKGRQLPFQCAAPRQRPRLARACSGYHGGPV